VRTSLTLGSLGAVVEGTHGNPAEILGPHEVEQEGRTWLAIRAFLPHTQQAWVVDQAHSTPRPMRRLHPAGFYEAICPCMSPQTPQQYRLRMADTSGNMTTIDDPYAFPTFFTDYDLYLLGEGRHYRSFEKLGAHRRVIEGVSGVNFAVWAPNASRVSVVGDFNQWDERRHALRRHHSNGVWEIFIPGLDDGHLYKYRIRTAGGEVFEKADPYAFRAEVPPKSASIVADLNQFRWSDQSWMHERTKFNHLEQPVSVYEVHLGSWKRRGGEWYGYRELAHRLVEYCTEMGFTHIELLPVSEHPFYGSWGYQPTAYFSVSGRFGEPEDFMYFVDHCHQNGIGVIIDWVPAHFPKDGHGLRRFDGTALYEHDDPRRGEHPDWGTMCFNYGRNEVHNFLISNALFWLEKYHIDGLRVDAVASMLYLDYSRREGEWVPNQHGGRENLEAVAMLQEFNRVVHAQFPGVMTIAEESTAWSGVSRPVEHGGLGFSIKWNMGWMNDTLGYMQHEPVHRRYHHNELTFSILYAFTENFALPLSHDEVVHGKGSLIGQMPGDLWQKFANLRLLYSYMWTHPGKKLLFMGGEFGQWNEWNHDAQLQWELLQWRSHEGLKNLVADLNRVYREQPALHEQEFVYPGFEWVDCHNHEESVLTYLRRAKDPDDFVLICCNFTPVVRHGFPVGVPCECWYDEIFNSDSEYYGGSNVGNHPGIQAVPVSCHGKPNSIRLTLPPLAAVLFKPRPA
jgi:1,4-alpha-glucan branching enzyme